MLPEILFYIAIFIVLLSMSAFFSGSETAFFSLTPAVLDDFKRSNKENEKRIAQLMKRPRQFLITIVMGNTIVNITTASIAALLATRISHSFTISTEIAILIDVIVVTLVILIVGEIIPKVIAVKNPESFSRFASGILSVTYLIFYPATYLLARFTKLMQNKMGFAEEKTFLSEEELKTLVEVGEEHGTLQKNEKDMIHSIFEFGETTVKEIMVPRTDMVCVEVNTTLSQLMQLVKSKLHSRIPVFKDRIDNIIGILYVKDLLAFLSRRRREKIDLEKLARVAYFVPEHKKIDELLREFQKERIHMALVVDEYGGIAGLVTLEDIIEEIVGEIQDEYDRESPLYKMIDENTFIVDGRMSLEEINDELNLNLPTEEGVETISGFILNMLGALPKEKETVKYNGYNFVVERVKKNRIIKIRIHRIQPDIRVSDEIPNQ